MKTGQVLRFYIEHGWPHEDSVCSWALLRPDMTVIERGRGAARDWPTADECEAVVSADQVSWLSVDLPRKLGRDACQIAAYALEDKLLEPPEAMHVVVVKAADGTAKSAIAIRRTRVQEILNAMAAAGRRLDRLVTELQLAPSVMGQWRLYRFGQSAFLQVGSGQGLAIDWTGVAPPNSLMLAISGARARGELPEQLVVAAQPDLIPDLTAWSSTLGVSVKAGGSYDPLISTTNVVSNLLTGPYAPKGKPGYANRYLRLSVAGLILAGVVHTLLSLADWAWLAYRAASLRTEATAIYRDALPDSGAPLLNPSLQFQREAAIVLREKGQAGGDDMLTMLALLTRELPPATRARRVHFDRSTLEIVTVLPGDSVRRIDSAVRLHGYATQATVLRQEASGTEYKIRMYPR